MELLPPSCKASLPSLEPIIGLNPLQPNHFRWALASTLRRWPRRVWAPEVLQLVKVASASANYKIAQLALARASPKCIKRLVALEANGREHKAVHCFRPVAFAHL